MSASLPDPIEKALKPAMDEAQVRRVWSAIAARRSGTARPGRLPWLAAAAALLIAAGSIGLMIVRSPVRDAGPLHRAHGEAIGRIAGDSETVSLSDGSSITASPGTQLDELQNDGHAVAFLLVRGHASFEVRPHGPRQWTVECGLASVTVVGTGFDVERDPSSVRVRVRHGVVLVRGDRVPDRVQRLTVGQEIAIRDTIAPTSAPPIVASATPEHPAAPGASSAPTNTPVPPMIASTPMAVRDTPATTRSAHVVHTDRWHTLAAQGAWQEAYQTLGADGIAAEARQAQVDGLMALADVARLSGHPRDAVGPLERVVRDHRSAPEAALAAFTLGRIELDSLGEAERAAEAFAQAIALEPPGALIEDAYARLAEARERAGDREATRQAVRDYLTRFPDGRSAARMRALADGPE